MTLSAAELMAWLDKRAFDAEELPEDDRKVYERARMVTFWALTNPAEHAERAAELCADVRPALERLKR